MWTGIPVYKLTEEETQKLLRMEDELHKRVVGQQDSIKAVSQAVRRTRAGLKDPKRPSGSFIFLGPSGVGKTELARTLSEFLFGDESAMITLDMSEYMEKHTVSRLVGSPPGYVGYEEGGQLTEAVRRKPFSVVLFDEIEKAHPDVFNTLLQILEEGRLTDAQGRSVDFRNTVLIMTSNLGTADLRKAQLGFGKADEAISYEKMKEKVNEALKQHFRPEFLNRIDETIVFHELSKAEVTQIVDLLIARTEKQLAGQGIGIELTPAAKAFVADKGYDPTLGARPLRRAIQRLIEDELSEKLLHKEFRAGQIVVVDAEENPRRTRSSSPSRASRASSHRPSSWPRPAPPTLMRCAFESSVTSVSWIPSEAIRGITKLPFELKVGHYDSAPPDHVDAAGAHRAARRRPVPVRQPPGGVDRGGGRAHRRPRPGAAAACSTTPTCASGRWASRSRPTGSPTSAPNPRSPSPR